MSIATTEPDSRTAVRFPFDNTYTRLPHRFYARLEPTPVAAPALIRVNRSLAALLGLDPDALASSRGVSVLAGNRVPQGADPIALAYAGHQFGNFVPQLGDGRAILLGEVVGRDRRRYDVQLKGSGETPFSRNGDGRAALGPVLREYLVSEAMAALGVPTTRSLAAVTTGETVMRDTELPGAVLTRVASSHIRIGTFEYFAARGDNEAVRLLADYVIARHYPEAAGAANAYRALLDSVIERQADLVARWLLVGFIHGVINTDNVAVSGETIDYGPCAFLDTYDPAKVFSAIDQFGRYAYANQPQVMLWSLARFAETLLPLLAVSEGEAVGRARDALEGFSSRFQAAYHGGLARKIGLSSEDGQGVSLAQDLLSRMAENEVDFTLGFRRLCDAALGPEGDAGVRTLFKKPGSYDEWAIRWRERLANEPESPQTRAEAMRGKNPVFIPRNHLVERAIAAAVERQDFGEFEALLEAVMHPFEERPDLARFAIPPLPEERVTRTLCGT